MATDDTPAHPILARDRFDDARLARAGHEVDRAHRVALLTDAIRTAVALVELHGIPRDVVVHDDARALQVQPFRGHVRRHDDVDGPAPKRVEHCIARTL